MTEREFNPSSEEMKMGGEFSSGENLPEAEQLAADVEIETDYDVDQYLKHFKVTDPETGESFDYFELDFSNGMSHVAEGEQRVAELWGVGPDRIHARPVASKDSRAKVGFYLLKPEADLKDPERDVVAQRVDALVKKGVQPESIDVKERVTEGVIELGKVMTADGDEVDLRGTEVRVGDMDVSLTDEEMHDLLDIIKDMRNANRLTTDASAESLAYNTMIGGQVAGKIIRPRIEEVSGSRAERTVESRGRKFFEKLKEVFRPTQKKIVAWVLLATGVGTFGVVASSKEELPTEITVLAAEADEEINNPQDRIEVDGNTLRVENTITGEEVETAQNSVGENEEQTVESQEQFFVPPGLDQLENTNFDYLTFRVKKKGINEDAQVGFADVKCWAVYDLDNRGNVSQEVGDVGQALTAAAGESLTLDDVRVSLSEVERAFGKKIDALHDGSAIVDNDGLAPLRVVEDDDDYTAAVKSDGEVMIKKTSWF